jgi:hypothetical protein
LLHRERHPTKFDATKFGEGTIGSVACPTNISNCLLSYAHPTTKATPLQHFIFLLHYVRDAPHNAADERLPAYPARNPWTAESHRQAGEAIRIRAAIGM